MIILKLVFEILIVGLFLHSKLTPYKDRLDAKYKKAYNFFNSFFTPIFSFLSKFFKPIKVGVGLSIDTTQLMLLIILLVIQNIF